MATKKITCIDNGPRSRPGLRRNGPFYILPKNGKRARKSIFSFLKKIRISNRKSGFHQGLVCSPRYDGRFGTFGSTFRFPVTAVFVNKTDRRVKKSSPTPLWACGGHRLPGTAISLSARRLDNNFLNKKPFSFDKKNIKG